MPLSRIARRYLLKRRVTRARESSSDTTNLRHPANRTDHGCSFRVRTIYRIRRRLAVDTRDSQIAICGSPAHNARARQHTASPELHRSRVLQLRLAIKPCDDIAGTPNNLTFTRMQSNVFTMETSYCAHQIQKGKSRKFRRTKLGRCTKILFHELKRF